MDQLADPRTLGAIVVGGVALALVLGGFSRTPTPAEAFTNLVNARYACKEFDPARPVPDALLSKLIELTQRSPTSFNTQPWVAVVVREPAAKAKLVSALAPGNQPKADSSPVNIVFAADTQPQKLFTDATPEFVKNALPLFLGQCTTPEAWAFKQTSFAVSTFLLAATAHGLATNPMEGFSPKEGQKAIREAVGLPERYAVPVVVSLGYEKAPRAKVSVRNSPTAMWYDDKFTGAA